MEGFKFNLGERVKVKSNGKEGTIKNQKLETYEYNKKPIATYSYNVYFGLYNEGWFTEHQLGSLDRKYTFDDNFELGLRDLMIDVNLGEDKFNIIEELQQKKTYEIRRSI